ncbi:hypothetical protein D3C85_1754840 [compost metagenome]
MIITPVCFASVGAGVSVFVCVTDVLAGVLDMNSSMLIYLAVTLKEPLKTPVFVVA